MTGQIYGPIYEPDIWPVTVLNNLSWYEQSRSGDHSYRLRPYLFGDTTSTDDINRSNHGSPVSQLASQAQQEAWLSLITSRQVFCLPAETSNLPPILYASFWRYSYCHINPLKTLTLTLMLSPKPLRHNIHVNFLSVARTLYLMLFARWRLWLLVLIGQIACRLFE